MLILREQIGRSREKKLSQQIRADLNSLLNEWSWQGQPFTSAPEFLTKMRPWLAERIKQQAEVQDFLKKWKLKKLSDIKEVKK